ncbi:MAG: starch-binding protein [Bacillota bacterium]|nr:starch-binding protein [Bacillota bacterium]
MRKNLLRKLTTFAAILVVFITCIVSGQVTYHQNLASDTGVVVHFYKPSGWSSANIYYYGDGISRADWPGTSMSLESSDWYQAVIPTNAKVLFNDGGNNQIPGAEQEGITISQESWYKDGNLTAYNPDVLKTINIYAEKPDSWSGMWIWYDSDLSTSAWDTTELQSSPGDMINYRTGWYKKTINNTNKVQFLFNAGTWDNKLQNNDSDFVTTQDVWIKKDGTISYTDPVTTPTPQTTPTPPPILDNDVVSIKSPSGKLDYVYNGGTFKIIYNAAGRVLQNSSTVTMHWGYDSWRGVTDTVMTSSGNNTWTATITIPVQAGVGIVVCFTDGSNWDNNSSGNWNIPLTLVGDPTPEPTPIPTVTPTI